LLPEIGSQTLGSTFKLNDESYYVWDSTLNDETQLDQNMAKNNAKGYKNYFIRGGSWFDY